MPKLRTPPGPPPTKTFHYLDVLNSIALGNGRIGDHDTIVALERAGLIVRRRCGKCIACQHWTGTWPCSALRWEVTEAGRAEMGGPL